MARMSDVLAEGREEDPLDAMYLGQRQGSQPPPESWLQRNKGIVRSLACSFLVAVVMNTHYVLVAVKWAANGIVLVLGKPEQLEKLEKLMDKAASKGHDIIDHRHEAAEKIKEAIDHRKEGVVSQVVEAAAAPVRGVVNTVGEKIGEAKEKGAQVIKDTKEQVVETKDKVVESADRIVNTLQGNQQQGSQPSTVPIAPGQKPPPNPGFLAKTRNFFVGDPEVQEKAKREKLEARAVLYGVKVEKDWSLDRLNAEIVQAQQRKMAESGPNGICPGCKAPLRVTKQPNQTVGCPVCPATFPARRARALFQTKMLAQQFPR